jgi:hypothetical protein
MPQTTYLPLWRASYPILAPAQKPGGVTVSTTLPPGATPNLAVGLPEARDEREPRNNKSKK